MMMMMMMMMMMIYMVIDDDGVFIFPAFSYLSRSATWKVSFSVSENGGLVLI